MAEKRSGFHPIGCRDCWAANRRMARPSNRFRVVIVVDRVPRRRPRTRLAIHRGVRCRMRLRNGTQTQGTTDRNDRRVATIRQGQIGGATVQAKPVVLRVPRVRSLSTEASAGRKPRCGAGPHLAHKAGTSAQRTFPPSAGRHPAPPAARPNRTQSRRSSSPGSSSGRFIALPRKRRIARGPGGGLPASPNVLIDFSRPVG
jgi:hypothetical protein